MPYETPNPNLPTPFLDILSQIVESVAHMLLEILTLTGNFGHFTKHILSLIQEDNVEC